MSDQAVATGGGVTFSEMTAFLLRTANEIDGGQTALVAAGLRAAPAPGKVRDREICEAIVHFIDLARGDQVIVDRLKRKVAAGKLRKEGSEVSDRVAGSGAA